MHMRWRCVIKPMFNSDKLITDHGLHRLLAFASVAPESWHLFWSPLSQENCFVEATEDAYSFVVQFISLKKYSLLRHSFEKFENHKILTYNVLSCRPRNGYFVSVDVVQLQVQLSEVTGGHFGLQTFELHFLFTGLLFRSDSQYCWSNSIKALNSNSVHAHAHF